MKLSTVVFAGAGLFLAASLSSGQSLAEVARKEAERRKTIKTPSKVYTNEDVRGGTPLTTSAPAAAAGSQPAATPAGAAAGASGAKPEPTGGQEPVKDEKYWRNRVTDARAQLERSTLFLDALQTRANSLATDFVARDDPAQRAVIAADRGKVLAEMERVKAEIADLTKKITDIEDEARREGVPPGWVR